MTLPQDFTGVDIARDWIDVFRLSAGKRERIATTDPALARFARSARGGLVILEASGGYERPLAEALARAGMDYARTPRKTGLLTAQRGGFWPGRRGSVGSCGRAPRSWRL